MPRNVIAPTLKVIIKIRVELRVIHESKALKRIDLSLKMLIVLNSFLGLRLKVKPSSVVYTKVLHARSALHSVKKSWKAVLVTDTWNAGE